MKLLSIFLLAAAFALAGCDSPANDKLERTTANPDGSMTNDIGVATFKTPSGWATNRSDGNTAVILIRKSDDRESPNEMFSIDLGKPTSATAEESANALAKSFTGEVAPFENGLDGVEAYHVSIPPNYVDLHPRECIVAHHRDKVCFLFAGSRSKGDIMPVLLEIAESWKWK